MPTKLDDPSQWASKYGGLEGHSIVIFRGVLLKLVEIGLLDANDTWFDKLDPLESAL